MVFFIPGGFWHFSAQSSNFGPQYLLDKNIVLVTVNNRMGSLGTFCVILNAYDQKFA